MKTGSSHRLASTLGRSVATVALSVIMGSALADEATFKLHAEETATGSNIRRDAVRSEILPLNKRYDEMTTEQRDYIRSWYDAMGPKDEPPFPSEGLAPIYREIAKAQNRVGTAGKLVIDVEIDAKGEPQKASIVTSPDPAMAKFVAWLLLHTTYKPALCNGEPCRMSLPFEVMLSRSSW